MLSLPRADRYALTNGHYHMAQALLRHANGASYRQIQAALHCSPTSIAEAIRAYRHSGLEGLQLRHHGRPKKRTPEVEAQVLALGCVRDGSGAPALSFGRIAEQVGVSRMTVYRVFRQRRLLAPGRRLLWPLDEAPELVRIFCLLDGTDLVGLLLRADVHVAILAHRIFRPEWPRHRHAGVFALARSTELLPPPWTGEYVSWQQRLHRLLYDLEQAFGTHLLVVIDGPVRSRVRLLRSLMRRSFEVDGACIKTFASWMEAITSGLRQIEERLPREPRALKKRPLARPIGERLHTLGLSRTETVWIAPDVRAGDASVRRRRLVAT